MPFDAFEEISDGLIPLDGLIVEEIPQRSDADGTDLVMNEARTREICFSCSSLKTLMISEMRDSISALLVAMEFDNRL